MVKEIIYLDFESIICNSVAEKYREDYELFAEVIPCYKKLTLKEYAYCKKNKIDECSFIKEKYGASNIMCRECNEESFLGGKMSIFVFIVDLVILVVGLNLVAHYFIGIVDYIYKIFQ